MGIITLNTDITKICNYQKQLRNEVQTKHAAILIWSGEPDQTGSLEDTICTVYRTVKGDEQIL